jgi:hypothetical protein
MRQSDIFRENAENCAHLAETANGEPAYLRFKRMEAAWRALADEQDWLDGEVPPAPVSSAPKGNASARANSGTRDSAAKGDPVTVRESGRSSTPRRRN